MIEQLIRLQELYDLYEGLLTPKQREYFELYYHEDLSLAEIADQLQISRNAVHDNIKRTEKALENYEAKLGSHQDRQKRRQLLRQLRSCQLDGQSAPLVAALFDLDDLE